MPEHCPNCNQLMPDALKDLEAKVVMLWNEIADRYSIPHVIKPRKYAAKIRTLLKDESELDVIRAAMVRFGSQDLIREKKFGLESFLRNRGKYLEAAYEDIHRVQARERGPSSSPGRITMEQMADAAGLELSEWKLIHSVT